MAKLSMVINGETYIVDGDPRRFTAAELNAVERYTGMTVVEFGTKLASENLSSLAISALAWIAVRCSGVFAQWDTFVSELSVMDVVQSFKVVDEITPDADQTHALTMTCKRAQAQH